MGTLLVSSFWVGALSSLHCAGMCGPLAAALGCARPRGRGASLGLFVAGKALSYALIGLAAGLLGAAFGGARAGGRLFGLLSVAAGAAMLWLGARGALGGRSAAQAGPRGPVEALLARALSGTGAAAPIAAGALAALLPCGLVYAMAARALAAGSAGDGAIVMTGFGLGTAPSLLGVGLLSGLLAGRLRAWGERLAWGSVAVMGLLAVWRGGVLLFLAPGGPPPCH